MPEESDFFHGLLGVEKDWSLTGGSDEIQDPRVIEREREPQDRERLGAIGGQS